MSWHVQVVGRNKEKLKEALRAQQSKDEVKNPHDGVPKRVVDLLCAEVDRVRIYEWEGKLYGLLVEGSGSFHEQGMNEALSVKAIRVLGS